MSEGSTVTVDTEKATGENFITKVEVCCLGMKITIEPEDYFTCRIKDHGIFLWTAIRALMANKRSLT